MLNARTLNGQAIDSAGILYVWHSAAADITAGTVIDAVGVRVVKPVSDIACGSVLDVTAIRVVKPVADNLCEATITYDGGDIFFVRGGASDVQAATVLDVEGTRVCQVFSDVLAAASINVLATVIFGAEGYIDCPSVIIAGVTVSAFSEILCSASLYGIVADEVGEADVIEEATIDADATRIRLTTSDPTGLCTSSFDVNDSGVLVTQYVYSDIEASASIWPSVGIKADGESGFTVEAYLDIVCGAIVSTNSGWLITRPITMVGESSMSVAPVTRIQFAAANIQCEYIDEFPIVTIFPQVADIGCTATITTLTTKINASQAEVSCQAAIASTVHMGISGNTNILSVASISEEISYTRAAVVDIDNGSLIGIELAPVIYRGAIVNVDGGGSIVFVDDEVKTAIQAGANIFCGVDLYTLGKLWIMVEANIVCQGMMDATIYSNVDTPAPDERTIYVDLEDRTITVDEEDRIIQVA